MTTSQYMPLDRVLVTIPADVLKAVAKLFAEVGSAVAIEYDPDAMKLRMSTVDPSKTAFGLVEIEPSVSEGSEYVIVTVDSDVLKRIAGVIKGADVVLELSEEQLVIKVSADFEKIFEIPSAYEVAKIPPLDVLEQRLKPFVCFFKITSEFLKDAITTLKKVLKPDSVTFHIEGDRLIITVPGSMHNVKIVGIAGSATVQEINCETEGPYSRTYPFEIMEAFVKAIKGVPIEARLSKKGYLELLVTSSTHIFSLVLSPRSA